MSFGNDEEVEQTKLFDQAPKRDEREKEERRDERDREAFPLLTSHFYGFRKLCL